MLNKVGLGLLIATVLFVGYLIVRAYKPAWFGLSAPPKRKENFVAQAKPVPVLTTPRLEATPLEAAPVVMAEKPAGAERTVQPGGPTTPNARPPPMMPRISPDAVPLDPYDAQNSAAPIEDTMRYPERSFGPGTVNDGTNRATAAGQASTAVSAAVSTFSPEFAQNGGSVMGSVFANDLTEGSNYGEV
jgi:hypothetical protein